jgi:lipopolysaccharide export system protein LptA
MKLLSLLTLMLASSLMSGELKVKANQFDADEKKGISIFQGNVNVIKSNDELNASKVTIYTDEKHEPTKFVAKGDVSFHIETEKGSVYQGTSQEVVYLPKKKEYHFFKNVHLNQIDEKKEIRGEEVVLKIVEGKAYAKGLKSEPVIMIFNMPDKEEK